MEQLADVDWRVLTEQINETLSPYEHDLIAVCVFYAKMLPEVSLAVSLDILCCFWRVPY